MNINSIKYIEILFILWGVFSGCHAQFFQATMQKSENHLIFLIRVNESGGDITTQWSDIEFFVRWPDGSPAFNFQEITVNTTDFPGISIPNNGMNAQGTEQGYTNNWFGTSFSATSARTYSVNVEYEVFRVAIDVPPADIFFELVHNDQFFPHYLALISGDGSDLTNVGGSMFYGESARICPANNNCPTTTTGSNHVDAGEDVILPVELVRFTANKLDQEVLLEWITASELNNQGFTIERSDISGEWNEIGFVAGNGTTALISRYDFLDQNPVDGANYYRLKQIDLDGSFSYSDIKVVRFEKDASDISIYPNPTSDIINIAFSDSYNGHLELIDQSGRVVMNQPLSKGEFKKTLNVAHLNKGVYFINIIQGDQRTVERIVLQ